LVRPLRRYIPYICRESRIGRCRVIKRHSTVIAGAIHPSAAALHLSAKAISPGTLSFKEFFMSSIATMPSIEQFIEQFLIAVDFQEPVEVTGDTELASLPEWDSLASLGVIVMFDTDFGKTISGDDIKKCTTIADLRALLG
jgi:acyl carrier protein